MSLVSRVNDLAGTVRDKINTMMPRLLPSGGTTGQVLTKSSAADYAAGWSTPSGGGGGGAQQVFVQQTRPIEAGPWIWWETDVSGNVINLTVNDGV